MTSCSGCEESQLLFDQLSAVAKSNPHLVAKSIDFIAGLFSQPEDILQPDKLDDHIKRASLETSSTKERYTTTFREQIAEIEFFHHSINDQVSCVKIIENHIALALRLTSEAIQTVPPNFSIIRQVFFVNRFVDFTGISQQFASEGSAFADWVLRYGYEARALFAPKGKVLSRKSVQVKNRVRKPVRRGKRKKPDVS